MKIIGIWMITVTVLLLTSMEARADFQRSCDARMFITLKGHDGYLPGERTLERFSSTATCKWWMSKNNCRRKAVDLAFSCMQAAWSDRWDRVTPDQCKTSRGIKHYDMPNIKCDLYDRICAEADEMGHPAVIPATAIVKGQTYGQNNSCSVTNHPFGEYTVNLCGTYSSQAGHCGTN